MAQKNNKSFRVKLWHFSIRLLIISIIVILLLEISYRVQIIEFYRTELQGLNTEKRLEQKDVDLLVFGDSFTAHPDSYIEIIKNKHPNLKIINSAIPGSGIRQHKLIFNKRIKKYKPKHILYQFYTGNDLSDIKHPVNYRELSLKRNLYWEIADQLLVLQFTNYRLAYLKKPAAGEQLLDTVFSVNKYNIREKLYFKACPECIENTTQLKGSALEEFKTWKHHFRKLTILAGENTKISILILPHYAQVSKQGNKKANLLGARLTNDIYQTEYPLIKEIQAAFPDVEILNPLEYFQRNDSLTQKLYRENDPHFSKKGQKELANWLAKKYIEKWD